MKILCTWLAALTSLAAIGAATVEINPNGDLRLGGDTNFFWFHSGPNWSTNKRMNRTTFVPARGNPGMSASGRFAVNSTETFDFQSSLAKQGDNDWSYQAEFRSVSGKPIAGTLYMAMDIPVNKAFAPRINDSKVDMPTQYRELVVQESPRKQPVNSFSFQTAAGQITLTGIFQIRIQDNRRYQMDHFHIRLIFPACSGNIQKAAVRFNIRLDTMHSTPVDLSKAANMGFTDPVADDGTGGWTDQGPDNDMAALPVGPLHAGGIDFFLIDPAQNQQKSCLVLSGEASRRYPPAGRVTLPVPAKHRYLYLLHGAAWVPEFKAEVGKLHVRYTDGTESVFPVRNGIDVGNWWRPSMSLANAFLGWRGQNKGGAVGLFASHFRLLDKPVADLRFEPTHGVWMVAAASFANLPLERPQETPYVAAAGKEWAPIVFDGSVRKNSPLDFSRFCEAPAGKYGWITIDGEGHFTFSGKPGKRIRFWGTNLAQSALFPTHAEADRLAETLAANGYNAVRLHQFGRGLMDRRANDTLTFAPQKLDRFFYLIAALKARGLYLCTDIYATRPIRPGDKIAECANADGMERKVLNFFSADAMRNWKNYAAKLLTTRNPYTRLTLAEAPALYMVCLDNEAPILETWNQFPLVAHVPEQAFRRHLAAQKHPVPSDKAQYREAFQRYLGGTPVGNAARAKGLPAQTGLPFSDYQSEYCIGNKDCYRLAFLNDD